MLFASQRCCRGSLKAGARWTRTRIFSRRQRTLAAHGFARSAGIDGLLNAHGVEAALLGVGEHAVARGERGVERRAGGRDVRFGDVTRVLRMESQSCEAKSGRGKQQTSGKAQRVLLFLRGAFSMAGRRCPEMQVWVPRRAGRRRRLFRGAPS